MKYLTDVQFWIAWIVAAFLIGLVLNMMRKS